MVEFFNRQDCLVHEREGFGCNDGLASWGQKARNIARSSSTHGHSRESHFDLCGWELLHRSCVAELTAYTVVPSFSVYERLNS